MYVVNLVNSAFYYGDPHNKSEKNPNIIFFSWLRCFLLTIDEDVSGRISDLRSGSDLKLRSKFRNSPFGGAVRRGKKKHFF